MKVPCRVIPLSILYLTYSWLNYWVILSLETRRSLREKGGVLGGGRVNTLGKPIQSYDDYAFAFRPINTRAGQLTLSTIQCLSPTLPLHSKGCCQPSIGLSLLFTNALSYPSNAFQEVIHPDYNPQLILFLIRHFININPSFSNSLH